MPTFEPDQLPQPGALALRDDLADTSAGRRADEVLGMLRAWGFSIEVDADVGVLWVFHPVYPRLQMDVPNQGVVATWVVEAALGLVDSLRVLLPAHVLKEV